MKKNTEEDDFEVKSTKIINPKYDYELFNEEDDIPNEMLRVKKTKNGWDIMLNNKIMFQISEKDLTEEEIKFLKTFKGSSFLISYIKTEWISLNNFKEKLRTIL